LVAAPSNVKNGYVRIEIESPSTGKKKSNDASYSVTCKKTDTLAPSLPDLEILNAKKLEPKRARVVDVVKVFVLVRNVGTKGAGTSKIEIKGEAGGVAKSWVADVPALGPGAQIEVEIPLLARGPIGKPLHIRVDSTHKVKELHETNNTYILE
jgi:subtilase family serine protease